MNREIYLDNAATTLPWPEVRVAVARVLSDDFGNASSVHRRGLHAAREIEQAAKRIAQLVGSGNWKVVFTSGGTESDNLAIAGSVPRGPRTAIVTSSVEHAAVSACCAASCSPADLTVISAGSTGVVDPETFAGAITRRTALVTVTAAANEMGTLQPVNEIAKRVKARNDRLRVHVDAVQAAARMSRLDFSRDIDMVSISAHKIHGPQGVGALLIRPGISLRPLLHGGDQQSSIRPGTLNLPGIVGFGIAAQLTLERREADVARMRVLAEKLIDGLCRDGRAMPLGDPLYRAPGLVVVAVAGIPSEVLLHALELRGVFASAGSACHARRREPPSCLQDAGLRPGDGALRFSLSGDTTEEEIESAILSFHHVCRAIADGRTGGLQ